jgi:hypothetical protein
MVERLLAHDPAELSDRHQVAIRRLLDALGPVPDAAGEMVARLAGLWGAMLLAAEIFHGEVDGVPKADRAELLLFVAGWFAESVRGEAPQHAHVAAYHALMSHVAVNPSAMYGSPAAGEKDPPGGWLGKHRVVVKGVPHVAVEGEKARELLARWGFPVDAVLRAWRDDGVLAPDKDRLTRLVKLGDGSMRAYVLRLGAYESDDGSHGEEEKEKEEEYDRF